MNLVKILSMIFLLCLAIGFFLNELLINFIIGFIPSQVNVVSLNPSDGFLVYFWSSISIALVFFSFFSFASISFFLKDVLYKKEKQMILSLVVPSGLLYVLGFVFGVYLYLLVIVPYFLSVNLLLGLTNFWSLYSILSGALVLGVSLGISFQLPLIIRNCLLIGLLKKDVLVANRFFIVFGLLLVSAFVTPPDVVSQLLVALPLFFMFELSMVGV